MTQEPQKTPDEAQERVAVSSTRLLDDGGYTIFILNVVKLEEHYAKIEVLQVSSWTGDDSKEPLDPQPYFEATIKWDGCSHVHFGGIENGRRDGYLHVCGVTLWKQHCRVMEWAYKETTKLIKAMSPDELWVESSKDVSATEKS